MIRCRTGIKECELPHTIVLQACDRILIAGDCSRTARNIENEICTLNRFSKYLPSGRIKITPSLKNPNHGIALGEPARILADENTDGLARLGQCRKQRSTNETTSSPD